MVGQAASSPEISELYRNAIVIDSLCCPLADSEAMPDPDLVKVIRNSGITAVNCTVSEQDFEGTIRNIASLQAMVDRYPESFGAF